MGSIFEADITKKNFLKVAVVGTVSIFLLLPAVVYLGALAESIILPLLAGFALLLVRELWKKRSDDRRLSFWQHLGVAVGAISIVIIDLAATNHYASSFIGSICPHCLKPTLLGWCNGLLPERFAYYGRVFSVAAMAIGAINSIRDIRIVSYSRLTTVYFLALVVASPQTPTAIVAAIFVCLFTGVATNRIKKRLLQERA